ncbi:MAG: hypothetical protein WAL89_11565 [Candidatus Sulfotelmatobacter sp.]|jgi:hypothetical protein
MKSAPATAIVLLSWLLNGAHAQVPAKPSPTSADNQPAEAPPTFVDLTLPQLLKAIPQLRGLKPAKNQDELPTLLEKIGEKAEALFHKTPNLLSHEEVLQARNGAKPTRQDFEYLILPHTTENDVTLDEYRVDLQKNTQSQVEPFNPAAVITGGAAALADLERRSIEASTHNPGALPLSQGFANSWVHFYPSNRSQATFRYLGRQRIRGQNHFVIAFAQIPSSVQSPGELRFEGKSFPIYYQGIAWVEESSFRIVHLRTDLLAPLRAVHLQRLTADIYFAETNVAHTDPLWLPQKVVVTVDVSGDVFQEQHLYSDYRAYVVETKIKF